jgi:tetratricopeptide (TPR) repeat protein
LEFDRELVPTTLALLVCARRGLSEAELSGLTQDCQLHGKLFLLLRWLRPYLWCSGGQLTIDHQLLREAVWRHYLKRGPHATPPTPEETVIRTRLARYFGNRDVDARQLEEVPWQLQEMHAWEPLFELLSDVTYLAQLNQHSARDVRGYWNQLTTQSTLRITDAYRRGLVNPARIEPHVELVARLFEENKQLDAAMILFNYLARARRRSEDRARLAQALAGQARILLQRADYPQAQLVLAEYAALSRQLGDLVGLQFALTKQAFVQRKQQHYQAALDLHRQEEQVCREGKATHAVAMSLINQAHLLADRLDNPAAALPLAEEAHLLAVRHGFHNLAEQVRIRLVRIQYQVCNSQQPAGSHLDPSSRFLEVPDSGLGF